MGKLKSLHIMCKRDTESVKVAPESVLSNKGESRRYALDQVFAGVGVSPGRGYLWEGELSPYTGLQLLCIACVSGEWSGVGHSQWPAVYCGSRSPLPLQLYEEL